MIEYVFAVALGIGSVVIAAIGLAELIGPKKEKYKIIIIPTKAVDLFDAIGEYKVNLEDGNSNNYIICKESARICNSGRGQIVIGKKGDNKFTYIRENEDKTEYRGKTDDRNIAALAERIAMLGEYGKKKLTQKMKNHVIYVPKQHNREKEIQLEIDAEDINLPVIKENNMRKVMEYDLDNEKFVVVKLNGEIEKKGNPDRLLITEKGQKIHDITHLIKVGDKFTGKTDKIKIKKVLDKIAESRRIEN